MHKSKCIKSTWVVRTYVSLKLRTLHTAYTVVDTTDQQHTSYVRGNIEGTEVNIWMDSGATESVLIFACHYVNAT